MISRPRSPSVHLTAAAVILLAVWSPASSAAAEDLSPATGHRADSDAGGWLKVRPSTLHEKIPAVGTLRAPQVSKLGTQVSGRIQAVLVDVGDLVEEGQPLVEIDPVFFRIDVDQQKANLVTAQARLESMRQGIVTAKAEIEGAEAAVSDADIGLQRMKKLWEKPEGGTPSIPKRMYDEAVFRQRQATAQLRSAQSRFAEAEARVRESKAGVRQAEQRVRHANQRLAETVIRAPFAGAITDRMVDSGESVTATPVSHLVEVQEVETLELEFSLPQRLLTRVDTGTAVSYEIEGLEDLSGKGPIDVLFPQVDEATRSFRCRLFVDNTNKALRPGLLVRVQVMARPIGGLAIPRKALQRTAAGWHVIVQENGREAKRTVEVEMAGEATAIILSGLKEGESIKVPK